MSDTDLLLEWPKQSGKTTHTGVRGNGNSPSQWQYIKNELIANNVAVPPKVREAIDSFINSGKNLKGSPKKMMKENAEVFLEGLNSLCFRTGLCVVGPEGVLVTPVTEAPDYAPGNRKVNGVYELLPSQHVECVERYLKLS